MISAGFTDSPFFNFGPSSNVKFFGTTIDTYSKYFAVIIYTLVNQAVTTAGLETVTPWMINDIQNIHKKTITRSPAKIQFMIFVWYVYLWSGRIFGIQIMLSQIDFLFVVLLSDTVTTALITHMYVRAKNQHLDDDAAALV